MKKITFILLLYLFFSVNYSFAQVNNTTEIFLFGKKKIIKEGTLIRCATTEYEEYLKSKNPNRLSTSEFEQWIAPKITIEKEKRKNTSKIFKQNAVLTIPVVVHVIHNGNQIGSEENIFDQQVISQIQVLNEDFRKKSGTPGFNTNAVGADVEIEFALAKQDPSGILSNGINRVNLGQESWSTDEIDAIVKPQTQWDPEKYLNIWVVKFTVNKLLGYAQFPNSSGLPGINANEGPANTDGVVIGYTFFGSSSYFPGGTYVTDYDKGRTASHEVGHWLGLRHIWGDGDCSVDDFCADTPNAGKENEGCPVGVDSCPASPGLDMIENYMDYTNDACMNIFTAEQKARMVAVMTNSPRRKELPSSTAGTPGTAYTYDAKVANIAITVDGCKTTFSPLITIENRGTTTLTTVSITYSLDNISPKTYTWTGSLPQYATTDINLSAIASTAGAHIFYATINTVNNQTDLNATNNDLSKAFTQESSFNVTTTTVKLDLQCDRDGTETTWTLKNSAGTTVYSGGPYKDSPTSIILNPVENITFALTNGECYTFTIYDSFGDGIATNGGKGSYILKDANGVQFASGGVFTFSESKSFLIPTLGIQDFEASEGIYVYPNPSKGILNVKVSNLFGLPDSLTISSSLGQIIYTKKVSAEEDLSINTSSLSNGVYFITILKDNKKKTLRFIKE
nr:M43 family zinc metalloprotease [uncultured Flavobacterium sp.]